MNEQVKNELKLVIKTYLSKKAPVEEKKKAEAIITKLLSERPQEFM
jgi:hypothetical protein